MAGFRRLNIFDDPIPNVVDAPPPLGFASDDPPLLINQSSTQPLLPRAHSLLGGSVVQHNIQHSIDDNSAVPLTPLPNLEIPANVSSSPAGLTNGSSSTKSGKKNIDQDLPVSSSLSVPPPLAIPVPSPRRASEKLLNRPMPSKIELPQSPLFKNVSLEQLPRSPLATTFSSPPQSPLFKDAPIGTQLVPLSLPPRPTLELQSGTHREMAVDVPDAFIPMAKQAPRYPPMKPSNDTLSRNTELPKVDKTRVLRNGGSGQTPQEQQMEMFLRSSIRQSKKLRELEKSPAPVQSKGVVNNAFEPEQVPAVLTPIEPQPTVDVTKLYDVSALQTALSRVIDYVGNDGGAIDDGPDLDKVMQLLDAEEFQGCLAITNIIKQILCSQAAPSAPVRCDAKELCADISQNQIIQDSAVGQELLTILNDANISQLLECHDRISKVFGAPKGDPANSVSPNETQTVMPAGQNNSTPNRRVINPPPELGSFLDEGENARIIQIDKTSDPLGATVRNEGESIIVGRVVKGGAAEKSGLLHEGDEIVAVNGVEMRGKTVAQVSDELANMHGKLTFLIIPNDRYSPPEVQPQTPVMHIKAHFDYDPEDDMYIPCRELGIGFQKGDILHVISTNDPNWWQAYKDGEDETTLAGLIPSKSFQLRREAIRQQLMNQAGEERGGSQRGKRLLCAPTVAKKSHSMKSSRKNSKGKMYNSATQVGQDEEPLLYEEVGLYYPRANKKRPVVLIGPSNIGKHELRERLMEDTARFAAAIPHTSRPRKDSEADGADYHFISRAQFENDILNGRFVEHGEYEKNYYGTSLQAIRAIVHSGQICVLNLHPESLKILKRSDLKPYIIFIAPPSLEKLRQNRVKVGASVKTEELKEIIEKARDIEENYGAYFDSVIINHDQERAYRELLKEIAFIEREPQWVPKQWLDYE
ncbi:MAGUK p55 subfamily member 5 [Galendromus occidentalis]|uniref:MAGUK p55 subfamily member 5 n=1 Tax=Galendromus occidentalis TaxID=34638 RepID=A0AAJ7SGT9_9ACAR|nr:MAGUK p55 subfamily member 5 [Galendromus occidentalis]